MCPLRAEIFCLSNEFLLGEALDQGTHYLAKRLTALGAKIIRIVHLRDERDGFVEEFRRFIAHEGDILVTVGGLGPTDDDNTLQYLATAIERPFEISNEALQLLQTRYDRLLASEEVENAKLTDARRRMAHMPRGATPVENGVGVAPGMMLETRQGFFVSLPAEPTELKAMLDGQSMSMRLRLLLAGGGYADDALVAYVRDESLLLPAMRHVRRRHPEVQIKSRSYRDEKGLCFRIHVSIYAERSNPSLEETLPLPRVTPAMLSQDQPARAPSFASSPSGSVTRPMAAITPAMLAGISNERCQAVQRGLSEKVAAAMSELRQELAAEGIDYRAPWGSGVHSAVPEL